MSFPDHEPSEAWIYHMQPHNYAPLSIVSNEKRICNRTVAQENGAYKRCGKELFYCDWCYTNMCPSLGCIPQYMIRRCGGVSHSKPHDKCTDCDRITCRISGICNTCEINHQYDMVNDRVAIGSYQAPYDPFDVVVNLSYPENGVEQGEIRHGMENTSYVIRCGFDDNDGLTSEKMEKVMKIISSIEKDTSVLLFHCYAGVSRSSTFAILYLAQRYGKTIKEAYDLVKRSRPRINPNPHFRKLIGLDA